MISETISDTNYYSKEMPDTHFGVDIFFRTWGPAGDSFRRHWHEHLQVYRIVSGTAYFECGTSCFNASDGDIIVINSREPHYLESRSESLSMYIIRIDLSFLFSREPDLCQTKFMEPLASNRITFLNLIRNDHELSDCIGRMISEYDLRQVGYELAIKSSVYELLVQLVRNHISRIMTPREFALKKESFKRFEMILEYIHCHYQETVSVRFLADQLHISVCHFCRTFRQLFGETVTSYINRFRLEKSEMCLNESSLSITEIALRCGFDSVNYYSRLFKMMYHQTPSEFRTEQRRIIK